MTIPTQGELFRKAADKEILAATFTRYAEDLDEVFRGNLGNPRHVEMFWNGPAADRFTTQATQLVREIGQLRESCATTADRLHKQAELLRREAAQLPS
ncbi:hypothetical protein ACIBI9_51185 [Nonomuraea sp. NPDC050451]|uniref:hypothetical protein n=1 Tax=Nonomuraea sp. NPDC050451 TaxID=3364364 RepID=UPI00379F21CE